MEFENVDKNVLDLLPQKPPFLFVDKIIERNDSTIVTQRKMREEEYFFKGHFPDNPIVPGVLLQEAIFQTGALLISGGNKNSDKIGVVAKVDRVKFKKFVKPNDTLIIKVSLDEEIDTAFYMSGKIFVNEKCVVSCKFCCSLVERNNF